MSTTWGATTRLERVAALAMALALAAAGAACGARARPTGDGGHDAEAGEGGPDAEVSDGGPDADCPALREALVVAFEEAVLCNPAMSSIQCTTETPIHNQCGCLWASNNRSPEAAAAAAAAWEAYAAGRCVPETCGSCREPTPTFGCVPLPVGTQGTCEIVD